MQALPSILCFTSFQPVGSFVWKCWSKTRPQGTQQEGGKSKGGDLCDHMIQEEACLGVGGRWRWEGNYSLMTLFINDMLSAGGADGLNPWRVPWGYGPCSLKQGQCQRIPEICTYYHRKHYLLVFDRVCLFIPTSFSELNYIHICTWIYTWLIALCGELVSKKKKTFLNIYILVF